ncbi:MAG: 3-dehydroquinate synthase [Saprospiraceae bacterium]
MINLQLKDYSINLAKAGEALSHFLAGNQYAKTAVLVDKNTRQHCLPLLGGALGPDCFIIEIPPGEQHKTLQTCQTVWAEMLRGGLDRHSLLINLGGGVIGDLGGFCAATYMRGINFVQVPTTLLSMADSSIGGKVGVDFQFVKNIIGVFQNPRAVFIDTTFLNTLPLHETRSGFAEIFKHGLIADASLWGRLQKIQDLRQVEWIQFLPPSLAVKKRIVEEDPHEKGIRKALNFGHTIGHAVESFSLQNDRPLLHGEAVALGIVCESFLSYKMAGLPSESLAAITAFAHRFYPPCLFDKEDFPAIMALMKKDKKNKAGHIHCSLIPAIGQVLVDRECGETQIAESLVYYLGSFA